MQRSGLIVRRRSDAYLCKHCGTKYAQHAGLCRTCARIAGDVATTREREAAQVEEREREVAALRIVEQARRPRPVLVVDGVEFEVVFSGDWL